MHASTHPQGPSQLSPESDPQPLYAIYTENTIPSPSPALTQLSSPLPAARKPSPTPSPKPCQPAYPPPASPSIPGFLVICNKISKGRSPFINFPRVFSRKICRKGPPYPPVTFPRGTPAIGVSGCHSAAYRSSMLKNYLIISCK